MRYVLCASLALMFIPAALACDFVYSSAALLRYYRAEGWKLPGTTDFNPYATPRLYGAPIRGPVPGAQAQLLPHDESPYIIEFPAQEFVLDGARKRMHPAQVKATIVRWVVGKRVVAYSYSLIPVAAHQHNGAWVVDSEALCILFASFIDDKGDGIFRVLVPTAFTADLLPLWAKPTGN